MMKTQHGSAPELRYDDDAWPRPTKRAVTEELDAAESSDIELEFGFDDDDFEGRPRPMSTAMDTAEVDIGRDAQPTVISPIPAMLAESMLAEQAEPKTSTEGKTVTEAKSEAKSARRDPAAPVAEPPVERTRKVGESDKQPVRIESGEGVAAYRHRAALWIDEARAALEVGDFAEALSAAEAAMVEADDAPAPGIVEVIEPARPLLARVFEGYVGAPGGIPVLSSQAHEIARTRLGAADRTLLSRIDGVRTMEELFDGSGLGSFEALRIAARLIRTGAIRLV